MRVNGAKVGLKGFFVQFCAPAPFERPQGAGAAGGLIFAFFELYYYYG